MGHSHRAVVPAGASDANNQDGLALFAVKRQEEGQQILKLIDNENGTYDLIVKKLED